MGWQGVAESLVAKLSRVEVVAGGGAGGLNRRKLQAGMLKLAFTCADCQMGRGVACFVLICPPCAGLGLRTAE